MGGIELFGLILAGAAGWFIWGNLKAREIANGAIRAACAENGFLFLNDTVALDTVRPQRDAEGHLRIRRVYSFEFSDTGQNRRSGKVTLISDIVCAVDIGPAATFDADRRVDPP